MSVVTSSIKMDLGHFLSQSGFFYIGHLAEKRKLAGGIWIVDVTRSVDSGFSCFDVRKDCLAGGIVFE